MWLTCSRLLQNSATSMMVKRSVRICCREVFQWRARQVAAARSWAKIFTHLKVYFEFLEFPIQPLHFESGTRSGQCHRESLRFGSAWFKVDTSILNGFKLERSARANRRSFNDCCSLSTKRVSDVVTRDGNCKCMIDGDHKVFLSARRVILTYRGR